ncbi:hypothetical protein TNCV_1725611 [Trichonephila clavipes]|nr:hypothetical protein TNCV_1725611 [Trichonephila clavipes]
MFKSNPKHRTKLMSHIFQEFLESFGIVISINTLRKEAHLLGSHGRAAAHKSFITTFNHGTRLRWWKALRNWTVDECKHFFRSKESRRWKFYGLVHCCFQNDSSTSHGVSSRDVGEMAKG